jgi:hypothetical protein
MTDDIEEFRELIREEEQEERRAAISFQRACADGNVEALYYAIDRLGLTADGWRHAARRPREQPHANLFFEAGPRGSLRTETRSGVSPPS